MYLEIFRPKQWIKNFFVFAGILFSQNFFNSYLLLKVVFAFFIFCLLSSSAYIFNDLVDLKQDRYHPVKSRRPLASGKVDVSFVIFLLIVSSSFSLVIAYYLSLSFFLVALGYLLLQLVYSLFLKRIIIIDVFAIACGFVLRVVAGSVVINVQPSHWLLICTTFLALFLGLVKRRYELIELKGYASNYRKVLGEYNIYWLEHMISIIAFSIVLSYSFYTISAETIRKFDTRNLIFTVPFVLYGVFRYLFLIYRGKREINPEFILLSDIPLIINIFLWVLTVGIILYK